MKYSILIEGCKNEIALDRKMIGKRSDYMVKHVNHILAPKATLERIDVAAELEDGYGVYWYRMNGGYLSYLFARIDYGSWNVKKNLIQD